MPLFCLITSLAGLSFISIAGISKKINFKVPSKPSYSMILWVGLPSSAMKLTFHCTLSLSCSSLCAQLCGQGWEVPCSDPQASSYGSHSPAVPFLWLYDQVFSVRLTPSPFLLCQALYWSQRLCYKVGVSAAFLTSWILISSVINTENWVKFTEAEISAASCSKTGLSNTTEWPCLLS